MNQTFPRLCYVFDRYKKASSQTKGIVELRITYQRKQKYISTGISLYASEWKGEVVNTPDALQLNQQLDRLLINVRQVLIDMGDNINIFDVVNLLDKKRNKQISFIKFCKQRAEVRKYEKSVATKRRYDILTFLKKQVMTSWIN